MSDSPCGNHKKRGTMIPKQALAEYIILRYKKQYKTDISPVKLQKALYLLFAFWTGFAARSSFSELKHIGLDESPYLFEADFAAWAYGPVDTQIYQWYKDKPVKYQIPQAKAVVKNACNEYQWAFIQDVLPKIFRTSDFSLIELTLKDICWKTAFPGLRKINNNEILREYTHRTSLYGNE